jgi:acyl carrier protein
MKLERLFADVLKVAVSEILPTTGPNTIGAWDSLAHIQLIISMESAYGVTFSAGDIAVVTSVEAAKKLLQSKGADLS